MAYVQDPTNPILSTQNFATATRATFALSKLYDLSFSVTQFGLPSISTTAPRIPTPFTHMPVRGDTLEFQALTIDFLVLEDFSNWLVLYDWIVGHTAPRDGREYVNRPHEYMDGYINLYTSHNNKIITFKFIDLCIVDLGEIRFNTSETDTTPLIASTTFAYRDYIPVVYNSKGEEIEDRRYRKGVDG